MGPIEWLATFGYEQEEKHELEKLANPAFQQSGSGKSPMTVHGPRAAGGKGILTANRKIFDEAVAGVQIGPDFRLEDVLLNADKIESELAEDARWIVVRGGSFLERVDEREHGHPVIRFEPFRAVAIENIVPERNHARRHLVKRLALVGLIEEVNIVLDRISLEQLRVAALQLAADFPCWRFRARVADALGIAGT